MGLARIPFLLLGILLVAVITVLSFLPLRIVDGEFDLPIWVLSSGNQLGEKDITAVRYYRCPYNPNLTNPSPTTGSDDAYKPEMGIAHFAGGTFHARVGWSRGESIFGWQLTHTQDRTIMIQVKLSDGRSVIVACPISDSKSDPNVFIDLEASPGPTTRP